VRNKNVCGLVLAVMLALSMFETLNLTRSGRSGVRRFFANSLALTIEQDNVGAIQTIPTSALKGRGAVTFATDTAVRMQFRAALLPAIRVGSIRSICYRCTLIHDGKFR
jgi:hypothetical protein